jgi:hypothetical protein
MTADCMREDCDREADIRTDFGPSVPVDPVQMCCHHASSFQVRYQPTTETVPVGGESE